jgi:hypothetical protein
MNTELSKLIARITEIENRGQIREDKSDNNNFWKDKEKDEEEDEKDLDEAIEAEDEDDSLEECDASLGECGGEITAIPMSSSQSDDTVSMTINMSGSGKGGIHDILDVIRNIENGKDGGSNAGGILGIGGHQLPVGDKEINHQDTDMVIGAQDLEDDLNRNLPNSPHERYSSLKDITASGDDMHKSKDMYARAQPGDNAMAVKERLESLYHFVKSK